MAFVSTDWTIDYALKTVTNDDSGTGNNIPFVLGTYAKVGPILEFFQWLATEFANSSQMDDTYPIESQTPTVYKWLNGWTFGNANDFKYLDGGSIEDPVGSGTTTADSLWANLYTIGTQEVGTQIYMAQADTVVAAPWWISGNIDILVLVKDTGVWTQSDDTSGVAANGGIWLFAREMGDLFDHNFGDLSGGGRNPVGINTAPDSSNKSGDLYLTVADETGFTVGSFVHGAGGAVGKIAKIDGPNNYIYLNAVRGGTFGVSEALTEYSDREIQTATGQSTTNDGSTAFTDVTAGRDAITDTFGSISRDLNNGAGSQSYDAEIDAATLSMAEMYEWLKYICRYESTGATYTVDTDDGQEYRSADEGVYSEVKVAPFGTLAGTTFYGARGIWVTNGADSDFVLIDASNAEQSPPNYQKVIANHTDLSGTYIFVAEISGGLIVKDQYTYDDAGSTAVLLAVNEVIDINKTPQSGVVRIGDNKYPYTAYDSVAKTFDVTVDPTGETNLADTYVPLLDLLADAVTEQSDDIIYNGDINVRTSVREYGFKPYDVDTTFTSAGLSFNPILADDPQAA